MTAVLDTRDLPRVVADGNGWVRCTRSDYVSMVPGKRYRRLHDEVAAAHGFARVVDESGDSYLYPLDTE